MLPIDRNVSDEIINVEATDNNVLGLVNAEFLELPALKIKYIQISNTISYFK